MTQNYVYDQAWEHERKRLSGIERWLDPGTTQTFATIGVGAGWSCLELGAGGGSVAELLCDLVGSDGRVVATDVDTRFLDAIKRGNIEVRKHDVVNDDIEEDTFDLIHARMLLEHLPARNEVIKKLCTALRPGGWLVLEDLDFATSIHAPPSRIPMWPNREAAVFRRVNRAVHSLMAAAGYDADFARNLPHVLSQAGLTDVSATANSFLVRGGDPATTFAHWTLEAVGSTCVQAGLATQRDVDRAKKNISDPSLMWMTFPVVAAWGRRRA